MSEKLYQAKRSGSHVEVTVNGQPLAAAEPVYVGGDPLSVAEFAWGDDSEGARYLAYCIFRDFAPDLAEPPISQLHHDFIGQIADDEWTLTGDELQEGIAFWGEKVRLVPPYRSGEDMPRLTIPGFIYRAFIKSAKFPGLSVKAKEVEQVIRKLKTDAAMSLRLREEVDPCSLAPLLRAAK